MDPPSSTASATGTPSTTTTAAILATTITSETSDSAVDAPDISRVNPQFSMGEQIQPQQSQAPEQLHPQSQPLPHPEIQPLTNTFASLAQATEMASELVNVPSQNPSPAAKLPSRPRKIRKLSPDTPGNAESNVSDSAISDSATHSTAITIVPEPTKPPSAPALNSRNSRSKLVVSQSRTQLVPRIVARPLSCEGEIELALRHLRNVDPLLATLIDIHQPPTFDSYQPPFLALTKSILYQQLAYKAGTSIYGRFINLCGGESGVLPEAVLALDPAELRKIGVSARKASYLHDLARKYQNGILSDQSIIHMDDKSLFTMLTMVNGIGSWSVHMFMIFSLHRPDVLPVNDLGVRKGVQLLCGLEDLPRPSQMEQLCEKWRPYRSVAAWYLWRFIEAKGTPSSAAVAAVSNTGMRLQQQQQQDQHLQEDQEHPHHQQQQAAPQFIDPMNGIMNMGACAWGQ